MGCSTKSGLHGKTSIHSRSGRIYKAVFCKLWRSNNSEGDQERLEACKTLLRGWRRPFSAPSVNSIWKCFLTVINMLLTDQSLVLYLSFNKIYLFPLISCFKYSYMRVKELQQIRSNVYLWHPMLTDAIFSIFSK